LPEHGDELPKLIEISHHFRVEVRRRADLEMDAALRDPPAEGGSLRGVDAVTDTVRLEVPHDLVDGTPVLVLTGVDRDAEAGFAGLLEQGGVVGVMEVQVLRAGDIDRQDAALSVLDRLLDDDLVQAQVERAIEAEDEPGLDRILERRAIARGAGWAGRRAGAARRASGPRSIPLFSGRRPAHAAAAARPRGLPFGVGVPDGVPVVVRRADLQEAVPHLGATKLLFGAGAIDRALEHDVAVVRGPDEAPPVLSEEIDQPSDLGEPLRRVRDEFAEPAGVAALAAIGAIELVADGPEDVNEDVGRTGHRHDVTRALRRSGSPHRNPWRSR